ncbi:MAG: hypothetical protein R3D35_10395 [Nitratireductor sp.]
MIAYVINEDVTEKEIRTITSALEGKEISVKPWPDGDAELPDAVDVAILIIRNDNTELEENRAIALTAAAIRIVCVFVTEVSSPGHLSQKYCSAKVAVEHGALWGALAGDDNAQEKFDGSPADRNPQKPHNC